MLRSIAAGQIKLRRGAAGDGVALVQGAMVECGIKLPQSTRKGHPDGLFGTETERAVRRFQEWKQLAQSGEVDKETILVLDATMVVRRTPRPIPAPVTPWIPASHDYKIGTDDPVLPRDDGSGAWGAKRPEYTYKALKNIVSNLMAVARATVGPNAAAHLSHFLGNSGRDYTVDLEGMLAAVPRARRQFDEEVAQAKEFCAALPPGRHQITSTQTQWAINPRVESPDWYYATAGYHTWGKGACTVTQAGSALNYSLEFEYHFFDRYNWDGDKKITLFGVTIHDEMLQEFHRQGLAREFDSRGSLRRNVSWTVAK